jgi:quercetin dioxygenase-like cupin family protein
MNTIAEHRRVLVEELRRKAIFVTRFMEIQPRSRLLMNAAIGVVLFLSPALQAEEAEKAKVTDLGYAKITDLMTKDLVIVPPGKEVTMITVDYAPGGADPAHRHDAQAFVYVLEGSVEMQMKGAEKVTLHPGDTFYEDPEGIHLVGRNASDTKPAKTVVLLIKEKGAPLLTPVKE